MILNVFTPFCELSHAYGDFQASFANHSFKFIFCFLLVFLISSACILTFDISEVFPVVVIIFFTVCLTDSVLAFHEHGMQGRSFKNGEITQEIIDNSRVFRLLGSDRYVVTRLLKFLP